MTRLLTLIFCLSACLALQFCSASRSAMKDKETMSPTLVSYNKDVAPILRASCTPCHFPDGGKKKFLDTYAAVNTNVDDILDRVQRPLESDGFMPWKLKKPALSDSLVEVIRVWNASGRAE